MALCCCVTGIPIFAQDNLAPAPPYLATLGDATWTMKVSPVSGGVQGRSTGGPDLVGRQAERRGDIEHQTNSWSDGSQTETWIIDGLQVIGLPGHRGVFLLDPVRDPIEALLQDRYDFDRITWLSATTFVDQETFQGRPCFVFKKPATPIKNNGSNENVAAYLESLPGQAWIDVQSRQLVGYSDGSNQYTYTYGPAPSAPLQPPADDLKRIKDYRELLSPLHIPVPPR